MSEQTVDPNEPTVSERAGDDRPAKQHGDALDEAVSEPRDEQ